MSKTINAVTDTPSYRPPDMHAVRNPARCSRKRFKRNVPLLVMFLPVALFFLLFRYIPMLGNVIAFKEYNLIQGIWGSPWVGLANFKIMLQNPQTLQLIRNTFMLSALHIVTAFPFPIVLAVMLSEVHKEWFKKPVQTLLYLPHFFSWVIVGGIAVTLFGSQAGVVNRLIEAAGGTQVPFLYEPGSWLGIFLGSSIWKEAGFSAIIYLAAIHGIDPNLYEAAAIDGAGKLKRIWHVTLPGILPLMTLMLIISLGSVMEVGFDQVYNLQNPVVSDISSVISTYVYTVGIQGGMYSMTAAMGLFEAVIGLVLVFGANALARTFNQSLW